MVGEGIDFNKIKSEIAMWEKFTVFLDTLPGFIWGLGAVSSFLMIVVPLFFEMRFDKKESRIDFFDFIRIVFGSIFWPVYWLVRIFLRGL